jgi:hypothetical protein
MNYPAEKDLITGKEFFLHEFLTGRTDFSVHPLFPSGKIFSSSFRRDFIIFSVKIPL